MTNESILNQYYNIGGFNKPSKIGYMMKMIRDLHPLTENEWRIWYLENVHDEKYIDSLAQEMHLSIPEHYRISLADCQDYIYDVMFKRTFWGYNKEKLALTLLKNVLSPDVAEAPKEWDTAYFIDFYLFDNNHKLIGIQLKPETFFLGHYQNKVDIQGKMQAFCEDNDATAYVLTYRVSNDTTRLVLCNPEIIDEIKNKL